MTANAGLLLLSVISQVDKDRLSGGVRKDLESLEKSLGNALIKTRKVRNMLKKQQKNGGNNGKDSEER